MWITRRRENSVKRLVKAKVIIRLRVTLNLENEYLKLWFAVLSQAIRDISYVSGTKYIKETTKWFTKPSQGLLNILQILDIAPTYLTKILREEGLIK